MIGSGHCLSVNAENLTTIFVLSGIFCFCVYPVSSNYTVCKRFTEEPLHRLTAVPLVLSGPLCPAGISPPRGESPLSGEASYHTPLLQQQGHVHRVLSFYIRYPSTDHSRGRNRHRQSRTKSRKISVQFFLQKGLTFFVGFGIIGVLSLLMPCMGEIQKEVY